MWKQMIPGLRMTILLTVLTGLIYPGVVTGICQALFPAQANGSLISRSGRVVGSALIGQNVSRLEYFQPRPSAAGSDGDPQETMKTEPLKGKWEAFGWRTLVLKDGHDLDAVSAALDIAMNEPDGRPTCILAYTVSGKGVSFMEGGWQWHLGFLGPKDLQQAYKEVLAGSIG